MPAPHQKNKIHPADQKNLLIFAICFGIVYLLFDYFVLQPHMQKVDQYHNQTVQIKAERAANFREPEFYPRQEVVTKSSRATFESESLHGSINLKGAVLDDITLKNYYETLEKTDPVSVMSPEKAEFPRYAEFGWLASNNINADLPNGDSIWRVKSKTKDMLTLVWQSPNGLVFERDIVGTGNFLLRVTQRIINQSSQNVTLFPYSLITEHGLPNKLINRWIIHEGPIGFINGKLQERHYSDMPETPIEKIDSTTGWIGFTEQYWLAAILPEQETEKTFRYAYVTPKDPKADKGIYQVDVMGAARTIPAGGTTEYTTTLFAGAKEFKTLQDYSKSLNINNLDSAIDFGWFWFLTKPFFKVLVMINGVVGYFAVTMLLFALILRIAIFPLANTSYRSFAKLRIISPRIMELKETYKDDKTGLQRALMDLYKKEKVNPAAGCLPMLIQIPIFFSLFKVLNIAIEMRHAPGFFWINDLSEPDPTSLFNLFGLLPYDVPQFLMIGAWPCIMVITLLIQKSMNPPPTDPVIRDMFRFMPYFMGFIMSGFAAGLIIYWTFSNMLSALQQYTIMRMMGVDVKFFQGWFGREVQQNMPDAKKLGFSDDMANLKTGKDIIDEKNILPEDEPKEISAPKPKKKKKKK